jgi:hypothetical protein
MGKMDAIMGTHRRIYLGPRHNDDPEGVLTEVVRVLESSYPLDGTPEIERGRDFHVVKAEIVGPWRVNDVEGWMD